MPSSYTPKLRLEKQATGENNNTWGSRLNAQVIEMIEDAIAGHADIDCTAGGNITLSTANGGTDQARMAMMFLYGTPAAPFNLIVPNQSKMWMVSNGTSQAATVKTSGGSITAVIPAGSRKSIFCDGNTAVSDAILGLVSQASSVSFSNGGLLSASDVQGALIELAQEKANTSNQGLTDCYVNTRPAGSADGFIANTAFVAAAISAAMGVSGGFPAGTRLLFDMDNPPAGWIRDVNAYLDDMGIRLTGSQGRGDLGGFTYSQCFNGGRQVDGTSLSVAHMPSHGHTGRTGVDGAHGHYVLYSGVLLAGGPFSVNVLGGSPGAFVTGQGSEHQHTVQVDPVGSGASHAHTVNMSVRTRTVIIGQKI